MIKIKALKVIEVSGGVVVLDEKQAKRRRKSLAAIKEKPNHFRVKGLIQFKAGEVLAIDAVPKYLMASVEIQEDAQVAEKKKPGPKPKG